MSAITPQSTSAIPTEIITSKKIQSARRLDLLYVGHRPQSFAKLAIAICVRMPQALEIYPPLFATPPLWNPLIMSRLKHSLVKYHNMLTMSVRIQSESARYRSSKCRFSAELEKVEKPFKIGGSVEKEFP